MRVPDNNNLPNFNDGSTKPREELISIATRFLSNQKIQQSPLTYRQKFLKSKGLTDEEISIAFERSFTPLPDTQTSIAIPPQQIILPRPTFWSRFRDIGNSIALIAGALYALYLFYKRFLHSFFFGKKKKKSLEDSIVDLEKSLTGKVKSVQDDVKKTSIEIGHLSNLVQNADTTSRHIQDLKAEFSSLKSVLLSGSQFPVPKQTPLVSTAIPSWQMPQKEEGGTGVQSKTEGVSDEPCGSGSSDPEMINNNGSDSSMELIRE
ncbi:peroxisomal membrane protein PEX14 [Schistocerca nitens]|uniref:peroxisomal membrane protein PEX14 n=1 Tax=Schistocerca nitens TaxID=7011 RepID=UPI00211916B4|nr:peroxisomal membrane protein PEX14 [Schistocerca nitens]